MAIYRRRLASSFFALGQTLQMHLDAINAPTKMDRRTDLEEDIEAADGTEDTDPDDAERLERQARIGLFETVVGRLQPILARLSTLISDRVLHGQTNPAEARRAIVDRIEADADRIRAIGFDIDEVTDADLAEPQQPPPPLTMDDLERVISRAALLPPGIEATPMGKRESLPTTGPRSRSACFDRPHLL
jgi:hypothetical protein